MWSQTLDYALRSLVQLAKSPNVRVTIQVLANRGSIPRGYLAKVMLNLLRAGLVSTQRGLKGGIQLAHPPNEISIWDVAEAVDPIKRIVRCPMNNPEHCLKLCPLHARLDATLAQIEANFRGTLLSSLVPTDAIRAEHATPRRQKK